MKFADVSTFLGCFEAKIRKYRVFIGKWWRHQIFDDVIMSGSCDLFQKVTKGLNINCTKFYCHRISISHKFLGGPKSPPPPFNTPKKPAWDRVKYCFLDMNIVKIYWNYTDLVSNCKKWLLYFCWYIDRNSAEVIKMAKYLNKFSYTFVLHIILE